MGHCVQNVLSWYQKKIGTYDKQQWEKTLEQRILSGFTHVPMKTAKLKTEFIDVDLVRGSAFTKAKPKHGLLTVTRLAVQRLIFLPFYFRWWMYQTSHRIFALLLFLYSLQLFNTFVLFYNWSEAPENIPANEILTPFVMMLVLAVTHSQIVSTYSANKRKEHQSTSAQPRRVKRTKRRTAISLRTRTTTNSLLKSVSECTIEENVAFSDGKYSSKIKGKSQLVDGIPRKQHRTVVWDTSPVKSKCDGNTKTESNLKNEPIRSNSVQIDDDVEPIVIISENVVNEEVNQPVTLEDDGFESLDGNGSSDSNKEEDAFITSNDNNNNNNNNKSIKNNYNANKECKLPPDIDATIEEQVMHVKTTEYHPDTENNTKNGKCYLHVITDKRQCRTKDTGKAADVESDLDKNDETGDTDGSEPVSELSVNIKRPLFRRRCSQKTIRLSVKNLVESSINSSGDESEEREETSLSSPSSFCPLLTEGTTSAGEWIGVTTNSEECSYSSELDVSDNQYESILLNSDNNDHPFAWELDMVPNVILSPSCAATAKVSCTMWEKKEVKKANLSVLDISSAIIARVEAMPENMDYFYIGLVMAFVLAILPAVCRVIDNVYDPTSKSASSVGLSIYSTYSSSLGHCYSDPSVSMSTHTQDLYSNIVSLVKITFGTTWREQTLVLIVMLERFCLSSMFFFLLTVAERTFKQRFLYAKFFSHLTSFRRARKSELPHFRLNKVRNIKTWLSVRSYLKKRGPQRSVDVIVSTAFFITVALLSFLSVELIKDSEYNVEALTWCIVIGIFMLRFMTLGTKINKKYRNLSTIITEQINLYLQIEQKPNKKEELMVANSVLKLAADLLKELESPFKISGFSANPYLYTVTKVVMLSALSGVLSEILGFKLKLHKIKIK